MPNLPATAAWQHVEARAGFEVVLLRREVAGYRFDGHSTAVEGEHVWGIRYTVVLDPSWTTRCAHVVGQSEHGIAELHLARERTGRWRVDGLEVPELDGCADVDLEASAFTNAFPVHRLALEVSQQADAPAAYVRAPGLEVERLEQSYTRLEGDSERSRYDYAAPAFDFRAELVYDEFGLVMEYPGIAVRVA